MNPENQIISKKVAAIEIINRTRLFYYSAIGNMFIGIAAMIASIYSPTVVLFCATLTLIINGYLVGLHKKNTKALKETYNI